MQQVGVPHRAIVRQLRTPSSFNLPPVEIKECCFDLTCSTCFNGLHCALQRFKVCQKHHVLGYIRRCAGATTLFTALERSVARTRFWQCVRLGELCDAPPQGLSLADIQVLYQQGRWAQNQQLLLQYKVRKSDVTLTAAVEAI
jgi:hypothetical protein